MTNFTQQGIVSELILALQRNKLSVDEAVIEPKLIEQLKNKRASEIVRRFGSHGFVNSTNISQMGMMIPQPIQTSEDPSFVVPSGCVVGKLPLPKIVNLVDTAILGDHGRVSISTPNNMNEYSEVNDYVFRHALSNKKYFGSMRMYYTIGDTIYLYPYVDAVYVRLVLFDPLEGFVIDTRARKPGELIPATRYESAEVYEVTAGQIMHDGVNYVAGDTFSAVNDTFSGGGVVCLLNKKRKMTEKDPYPMDTDLKDYVIRRILQEDYAVELQTPGDTTNDGTHDSQDKNPTYRVQPGRQQ